MHEANEAAWPPRQAAIFAAAVKVFVQLGYRKTLMEDVAVAAEVSRQTLYLQFCDKGAVISCGLEIFDRAAVGFDQRSCRQSELPCGANTDGRIRGLCGDPLAVSSHINIAELVVVARS
jgi:hypothetical protein